MSAGACVLPVVPVPGLRPDSLGNYLASLGLLRVLARRWPRVRIAWRDEVLNLVGGPGNLDDLLNDLSDIASNRRWTPYERGWATAQKSSTKAGSGIPLALWEAEAGEQLLELFSAHAVPTERVHFNPLLGTGGNAGRRAFSDGWKKAIGELASQPKARRGKNVPDKRGELEALLLGKRLEWMLEKLNAASWFSDANKLYNSGQGAYREGAVSPWAMALACEGLAFLAGGASRRLGARARAVGAFPFVTHGAAPEAAGEAGRDLAEVWAPIWARPMSLPEVRALFSRGRAEVRGRGVLTPGAFATAILRRGVDAGIDEFRRFVLGRTTSAQTFEPRLAGRFAVKSRADPSSSGSITAVPEALERVLGLVDRLLQDRKVGKRWRFVGLRGPIEGVMLRLAAAPDDPEAACSLLDAIVSTLDRVDRTVSFRKKRIRWDPLPAEWVPSLFGDQPPEVEARLALALVSSFPVSRPFAVYRFGTEMKGRRFEHPERPPARWVFRPGPLPRALSAVLRRRTLDWEAASRQENEGEEPVRFVIPARCSDVSRWLEGAVDETLLARWIDRLALFDWRAVPEEVRRLVRSSGDGAAAAVTGALCLYGLFHPLFDLHGLRGPGPMSRRDLLDPATGARTPAVARALVALMGAGQLDSAIRLAASRYAVAGTPLARVDVPWQIDDPDRLLAAMLFPVTDRDRAALAGRWLRPQRQKGETIYV